LLGTGVAAAAVEVIPVQRSDQTLGQRPFLRGAQRSAPAMSNR
jgi:hypothetical protein